MRAWPERLTVLAYALFAFVLLLAAIAVIGAVLAGLDREIALVQFLDHQHGDRPVRGTLRLLDRTSQIRQPDRLAVSDHGRRPPADCGDRHP